MPWYSSIFRILCYSIPQLVINFLLRRVGLNHWPRGYESLATTTELLRNEVETFEVIHVWDSNSLSAVARPVSTILLTWVYISTILTGNILTKNKTQICKVKKLLCVSFFFSGGEGIRTLGPPKRSSVFLTTIVFATKIKLCSIVDVISDVSQLILFNFVCGLGSI